MSRQRLTSLRARIGKQAADVKLITIDVWRLFSQRRLHLLMAFVVIVVNRLCGLIFPASSKYLIDNVVGKRQVHLLLPIAIAVLAAYIVQGLSNLAANELLTKSAQRMVTQLRIELQRHLLRLSIRFYDASKTGAIVSRVMSDVEGIRSLVGVALIDFAGSLLTALFATVMLFRLNAGMTGVVLAITAGYAIALTYSLGRMRSLLVDRRRLTADVSAGLTESIGGVRVIKSYRAEEREYATFSHGSQRLLQNVLSTVTANSRLSLGASLTIGTLTVSVMWLGIGHVLAGTMTLGTFVTYTGFLALLIAPVSQAIVVGPQLTDAVAGLERARELLREEPEGQEATRTKAMARIHGQVQFENVTFEYEAGKPVLHNVSFEAFTGTVTALVGRSGAGKSTIVSLIAAFYNASCGRILVDGINLAHVQLDSYRSQLGVVFQDTFLFDGTIQDNVAFARPDASVEEVRAACRLAHVDEFAERLKDGYATVVGERGLKLSGGQKQRVAIARAILADPRILILDEATSNLDCESEGLVQEGLRYLMRGRTTFVVAHRLSTIQHADQILVLDSGRLVEKGVHGTLYRPGTRYYDLYNKQYAGCKEPVERCA